MASVEVLNATKRYGEAAALDNVSLSVASGEFMTLLGPSGCGKSTLLRAIAGLNVLDRGMIRIGERDVTSVDIHKRDIGMVFQNLALFPHMTVAQNVAFGLRMRKIPKARQSADVGRALALVRLPGFGGRFPHQLSGGQQQRVAIARALVFNPKVLLLDEPFASLDRKLREEMQMELREITRQVGITTIFVTHDQEEAMTLSDRIAIMNAGRVEQIGGPTDVYARPRTRFAADFMAARNILEVAPRGAAQGHLHFDWGPVEIVAKQMASAAATATAVAIRPESIRLARAQVSTLMPNEAAGKIAARVDHGAFVTFGLEASGLERRLTIRCNKSDDGVATLAIGDAAVASWRPVDVIILEDPCGQETTPRQARETDVAATGKGL